jgi:hypothetical protein
MRRLNMDFEYFTKLNPHNVYIDEREARVMLKYAVYNHDSCVADCLKKAQALAIANECINNKQEA